MPMAVATNGAIADSVTVLAVAIDWIDMVETSAKRMTDISFSPEIKKHCRRFA